MPDGDGWVSASDLAEYAYCPRAHYYRAHPPPGGERRDALRRAAAGRRYHARELGRERRREAHGGAYWAMLAVGVVCVLGGLAWWLYR
ncbi:MAG TPA: hypothetical protein VMG99_07570 [Thermoplasmata archaeon]|jgi:CRISPR/Cas system-associated exonuclease Cas4 (RecB family)|nr:hypothetical protein [Thermoplasmata archaeon]